ncbi:MAG: Hsp70 family protein [bacterium]|nr:Hsp70 family protein [bacterium]
MGHKYAIDFGTTNSVIARWDETKSAPEVIRLPIIGTDARADLPPVVPTLLYVNDARTRAVTIGQTVRDHGLDQRADNRLFRNFKRGIVSSPAPDPRTIDSTAFADVDAGTQFLHLLMSALPTKLDEIEQLVLTAPVASFEGYLTWLNNVIDSENVSEKIRIIDESTAAALGYTITEPKAIVLVFDFGGGTLDLSLVELPEGRSTTGGFLRRLLRGSAAKHTARVIAKAGRVIGGSDVDQWLLTDVLKLAGVDTKTLGVHYTQLLTACEQAKIALSTQTSVTIQFQAGDKPYTVPYTREALEALLEANGFYTSLRRVVDKVMHVARQRGIFKEDIRYVLLVGGTSLMPSVQRTLQQYFNEMAVRADKPFTAVAEGALLVAAGYGLEDYLAHSYGIRHFDPATQTHQYDEIIPMGSRYPSEHPVEVYMGAAHPDQAEIEFVVGEIDSDSVAMIEVKYEEGQAVFVAQANSSTQQIVTLNADTAALARLIPPGKPGQERLRALFSVDDRRQLRLTVMDIQTDTLLLENAVVASLR